MALPQSDDGRRRVAIERVRPEVDDGRFAIKRVVGEGVTVEANVFTDGHDLVACQVLYRRAEESAWQKAPMRSLGNDRWRGQFCVDRLGRYVYTVEGWIDHFLTWRSDFTKRVESRQDVRVDLLIGAALVEDAARQAGTADAAALGSFAAQLRAPGPPEPAIAAALNEDLLRIMQRCPVPTVSTIYDRELAVVVDRERARFSTWYEIFPRSCSPIGSAAGSATDSATGGYGTLRDCAQRLPYIAAMGFDVVYLPPVHPIGHTHRKGKNNSVLAEPEDVGSPWAIGSEEGGHTSIDPRLGSLEDFRWFVAQAKSQGLEVALDIAFQCSPDHPYVRSHPEWFRKRPDGSLQCAENPPKKYEDIYPLNFDTADWQALWRELKGVFDFWMEQGVRIFRVDNPHTKPFAFWQWAIDEIKRAHPEVILLAEAFTRPAVMYRLAKLGFSQSYTYFTWRTSKQELTDYFTELTRTGVREYFRPNLWPNTPDILHGFLQTGGRPAFMIRLLLAATLGSSYGIYGPPFELCENLPLKPGSEEYLHSEKYELRRWDLDSPASLKGFIARINRIRRENPALQSNGSLRFHQTDNPSLVCYSKTAPERDNVIIVAVNLDPYHVQSGWVYLDARPLGLDTDHDYQVHDLLGDGTFTWRGPRNFLQLTPEALPAHILTLRNWVHTEQTVDDDR